MLNMAIRNTKKLIREKSREQNIRIGRFFTKKGAAALMSVMCRASSADTVSILDPGDEVLIPQPSYVSYEPCCILANGTPVIIELKAENQFRLTAEELEAAITPKTKLLVLPFPNNPTGAIMEKEDLEAVAEVVKKHDLYVISDEIYSELTYKEDTTHVTIASLPGMKERTVLINGFSKAYAMTGWRLGYACGPELIIKQMTKIHQFAIMCAPTTSQYAAVEALKNGDEDVARMREEYNGRRRYLMHRFKEMGLDCFEPFGAFYVFPCIKEFGMTSDEFATELLNKPLTSAVCEVYYIQQKRTTLFDKGGREMSNSNQPFNDNPIMSVGLGNSPALLQNHIFLHNKKALRERDTIHLCPQTATLVFSLCECYNYPDKLEFI